MAGKLYLCPTPIGNLGDMTKRAKEVLSSVDYIAAEDTRNSMHLLQAYGIHTPMISYHKFNEEERSRELIEKLKAGAQIALITDAGMPAISDPGQILVHYCHQEGIEVTALPGPCAFVTALALSGFESRSFVFEGFLPQKNRDAKEVLDRLAGCVQTTIFYEAPHRLTDTLKTFGKAVGDRQVACVRELTKKFEQIRFGTVAEHLAYYQENEPRGEFVILIEGLSREGKKDMDSARWQDMTIAEHAALYPDLDEKEMMKRVAKERGLSKQDVYRALKIENEKR